MRVCRLAGRSHVHTRGHCHSHLENDFLILFPGLGLH
jgi:hypothetical protein